MAVKKIVNLIARGGMIKLVLLSVLLCDVTDSGSVQLNQANFEDTLQSNDIVFVNFYADWCRFSQMLAPVFDEAAEKIAQEFQRGKAVFGKVDCDRETSVAAQYHVTKYPTLKLWRYGSLVKREYRGQRSVDALSNYIREQLKDSIEMVANVEDLDNLDRSKRHVIGYFDNNSGPDYQNFIKLANHLKDDCKFHAAIGHVSQQERIAGNKITYRPQTEGDPDILYSGPLYDYQMLQAWANDKCVPLVREITFENAEELTEEGLPFLILFHNPDDKETPEIYSKQVAKELMHEKNNVNFLTANGLKFTHPLHHLGKTTNDLPVLAIDSFRHMYLWPHNVATDLTKTGLLSKFIADLHSGKLHREFHHGPDEPEQQNQGQQQEAQQQPDGHVPNDPDQPEDKPKPPTNPPESTFKKLAPSRNRYTLLRDEL